MNVLKQYWQSLSEISCVHPGHPDVRTTTRIPVAATTPVPALKINVIKKKEGKDVKYTFVRGQKSGDKYTIRVYINDSYSHEFDGNAVNTICTWTKTFINASMNDSIKWCREGNPESSTSYSDETFGKIISMLASPDVL